MKKNNFTGKIGFVLAAAGSAIGLGNIWRFPYLAAKHGGGVFLVTYLVLALTFGYALLITENAIGRMTGRGPIGAFRKLCGPGGSWLRRLFGSGGWVVALVPMIILPYYCVIGGWVIKYAVAMLANPVEAFSQNHVVANAMGQSVTYSAAYFRGFVASPWESLGCFLAFVLTLLAVSAFGVQKGIERFNKILMPMLFLLILMVCGYCCFLPNAGEGFSYYLRPDVGRFGFDTIVAAMGQLFFSLSIAMGIMITYGSYMRRDDDLLSCVNQVEFFDTAIAFLCGLMIIPAVVAFGGRAAAESAGPGLVFVTMPQVFANFPGGRVFGAAFFLLVLFAAATSAISILETNVQTVSQELRLPRLQALAVCVGEALVLGVPPLLGYSVLSSCRPLGWLGKGADMDILDSMDFVSNGVLMPLAAILTTLLALFVVGLRGLGAEIRQGRPWRREGVYRFCMRALVIPGLLLILIDSTGALEGLSASAWQAVRMLLLFHSAGAAGAAG